MVLAAVAYVAIGVVSGALARSADSDQVRLWRLAAWVASAAVAAAQIWYEHYRVGSSPRPTALRAAGAGALGAFGLALAASGVSDFVCGTTDTGRAYCWGAGAFGQLGNNTFLSASEPVLVRLIPTSPAATAKRASRGG